MIYGSAIFEFFDMLKTWKNTIHLFIYNSDIQIISDTIVFQSNIHQNKD